MVGNSLVGTRERGQGGSGETISNLVGIFWWDQNKPQTDSQSEKQVDRQTKKQRNQLTDERTNRETEEHLMGIATPAQLDVLR